MCSLLNVESIEEANYSQENVVEIYSHTVKQEGEDIANELTNNPIVNKLCDSINLLNGFLNKKYTIYQLVNSPNFISFIKNQYSFKKNCDFVGRRLCLYTSGLSHILHFSNFQISKTYLEFTINNN